MKKIETSICGQAGSKKEMVEFLFRKGINSISVNADAAHEISLLIKNMEEKWKNIRGERMKEDNLLRKENKLDSIKAEEVGKNSFNGRNDSRWNKFKKWKEKRKWYKNKEQKKLGKETQIIAEIPIDNLEKINGKIEEIQEKINNEKKKELEEMEKIENNIKNIIIDDDKDEDEQKISLNEVFDAEIGLKEFEEIGVYNPDEDLKDNKKYKYDFEDA